MRRDAARRCRGWWRRGTASPRGSMRPRMAFWLGRVRLSTFPSRPLFPHRRPLAATAATADAPAKASTCPVLPPYRRQLHQRAAANGSTAPTQRTHTAAPYRDRGAPLVPPVSTASNRFHAVPATCRLSALRHAARYPLLCVSATPAATVCPCPPSLPLHVPSPPIPPPTGTTQGYLLGTGRYLLLWAPQRQTGNRRPTSLVHPIAPRPRPTTVCRSSSLVLYCRLVLSPGTIAWYYHLVL